MRTTFSHAILSAAVGTATLFTAHTAAAGDAFLCYRARGASAAAGMTIEATDERVARDLRVGRGATLCEPMDLGDGIADADTHLRGYRARPPKDGGGYEADAAVVVSNELGDIVVDVRERPGFLLAPASVGPGAAAPDPSQHDVDHYRCHAARATEGEAVFPRGTEITVAGAAPRTLVLTKPKHLCSPVALDGESLADAANSLLCYAAKRAKGQPKNAAVSGLPTHDSFGLVAVNTFQEIELCLPSRAVARCNGFLELCDRGFADVAHATTHNSMSNLEEGWLGPNQRFSITRQLDDGIRGLMLDTWYFNLQPVLCHGGDVIACDIAGMKPLADGLAEITDFLDRRPNEVVTIIFESYITEADTEAAFIASDLLRYVHVQVAGDPWPTLRELVEADTRLIVFTDQGSASRPWHHYVWSHAWETRFSFQNPSQFSCNRNRGSAANPLFILNHFLTNFIGSPALAEQVNHNPLFINRALQCEAESGRLPNFVTVDFHDIGDVFEVVNTLNGVGS